MKKGYIDFETGEIFTRQAKFVKTMLVGMEKLIQDKELRGGGVNVFLFLVSRMDYDNVARVHVSDIVDFVGAGRTQVSKALNLLARKGYISIITTKRPNIYKISPAYFQKGAHEQKKAGSA